MGCGRAMATAELAVLVLALTSGNANARRGLTATASLYDADRTLGAFLGARTSRNLRTEGVTSAHRFATQLCEAVAVRVGVALTVGESSVAAGATCWAVLVRGQGYRWDAGSECYTSNGTGNAAHSRTSADLLISQGFGDVFEPVCHRHLLVDCVGGINAVIQHTVPQRTELASSIQK